MKRLYLIRHAKSSKDVSGVKDKERPLNERGEREAKYIGRRLRRFGISAQALYSSPAKRAHETATRIANEIGFPLGKIKAVDSLYESSIPKLMKIIKKIDNETQSAIIFGHNPEFLNLLNYLTARSITEFPTCGVFGIDFNIDSWNKVARGKGAVAFFECPKK